MALSHLFLTLLVVMIWGFNFVVIKLGLSHIPPLFFVCISFFLTSIPAIFFIKKPAAPWKMIAGYGILTFTLQFALLFLGMSAGVPPGLASLLVQLQAFFTVLLAVIFLKEKLGVWQIAGIALSFSGIALVASHVGGSISWLGFFLVIGAALAWACGNIMAKKMGNLNQLALVIWGSFTAWPPLLILSLLTEDTVQLLSIWKNINWLSLGSIAYIAYLCSLFGFGIWNWLLSRYSLGKIAPFAILVPIFGILSSVLVLKEPLQSWKILAASLVVLGLLINVVSPYLSKKQS